MTGDEILKELEKQFIITKVGDSYFMTNNAKTLPEKLDFIEQKASDIAPLSNRDIVQAILLPTEWDKSIIESVGRSRVTAMMDLCDIPSITDKRYRLRGFDKDTVTGVNKIVKNKNIKPIPFIESVKRYYATMEFPKAFKNYIAEGDAMEVYEEFIELAPTKEGGKYIDPSFKPNETWG